MEASMEAEEEGHHEMDTTETQPLDEMSKEEVESKGDLGKKSKKQGKPYGGRYIGSMVRL